jgi:hypothetical protein
LPDTLEKYEAIVKKIWENYGKIRGNIIFHWEEIKGRGKTLLLRNNLEIDKISLSILHVVRVFD